MPLCWTPHTYFLTGALPAALLVEARGAVGGRARRLGGSLARVGGVHAWVGQIVLTRTPYAVFTPYVFLRVEDKGVRG